MKDFNKAIEGLRLMTPEELAQSIKSAAIETYKKPTRKFSDKKNETKKLV